VTASGTALNAPANTQTADQIKPTVARIGNVGSGQYFYDPTAFAPVNQPRFGTSGLNILRIPNWINMDLSVLRRFSLRERFELELHGDAFNSLNTPHFDAPNGNVNSASFMQITSAEPDQRQLSHRVAADMVSRREFTLTLGGRSRGARRRAQALN
jgi:hypothetical protein